jgi:secondary thiamine-phosphate synthase enzyme
MRRATVVAMRQAVTTLAIATPGRSLVEVTDEIVRWTRDQQMAAGLLTVFCRHTSASLLIQENADPDVQVDLAAFFERIAPEDAAYVHDAEGPDDMPAHIRAALTPVQLSIPLIGGRLALGTWQGVYLFEHRRRPHRRELALHLFGE